MKQNQILILAVVSILFATGGFFGGMKYQQSKSNSFRTQAGGINGRTMTGNGGQNIARAGRMGGGQVVGEIISSDDKSVTIKLADGSSKIVLISGTTSINKAATASIADFKVGEKAAAFGTANTDGSITAQNIQLNPINREIPKPSVSVTQTK